ncbi:MAG: tetratricopeptide repeat protein [Spirochaetales bacterium]|nr:tetratricopeptide repeat protein [Spirochaetales bacterium]
MFIKKVFYLACIILFISFPLLCEDPQTEEIPIEIPYPPNDILDLKFTPEVNLPLGQEETTLYDWGFGLDGGMRYAIPGVIGAAFEGGVGYKFIPIRARISMSLAYALLGVGFNWNPLKWLSVELNTTGGYYYGLINNGISAGTGGGGFFVTAGLNTYFKIVQEWGVRVGCSYNKYGDLYQGFIFSAGPTYHINLSEYKALDHEGISVVPLYAALYKYYKDNPIGTVVLKNDGASLVKDIEITFQIPAYQSEPIKVKTPSFLYPADEKTAELFTDFSQDVLYLNGETSVQVIMKVKYDYRDWDYTEISKLNIPLYDKNTMEWDDIRKAATYVDKEDPVIQDFSGVISKTVAGKTTEDVEKNLLKAMAIHETLSEFGLKYSQPADGSAKDDSRVNDKVLFPRETLDKLTGSYIDITLLYCSLLESQGVETAIISIPGGVLPAFALSVTPKEAPLVFMHMEELIVKDDKVWLPLDISKTESSFLENWQSGARKWRTFSKQKKAGFYPLKLCWETFPSITYLERKKEVAPVSEEEVVRAYQVGVYNFIEWEIKDGVTKLTKDIKEKKGRAEYSNRLGTLYARYGRFEQARSEYNNILRKTEYVPALINLGHINMAQGRLPQALNFYDRAYRVNSYDRILLLSLAAVYYRMGDFYTAQDYYFKLLTLEPDFASAYSFLGESPAGAKELASTRHGVLFEYTKSRLPMEVLDGDTYYEKNDLERAKLFYEQAYNKGPQNPYVVFGMAKIYFELLNFSAAKDYFARFRKLRPEAAEKFNYLDVSANEVIEAAEKTYLANKPTVWVVE